MKQITKEGLYTLIGVIVFSSLVIGMLEFEIDEAGVDCYNEIIEEYCTSKDYEPKLIQEGNYIGKIYSFSCYDDREKVRFIFKESEKERCRIKKGIF